MAKRTYTGTGTNPLAATIAADLVTDGFVEIDSGITFNYTGNPSFSVVNGRVLRSPAASNSFGQSWYILLGDMLVAPNQYVVAYIMEDWDAANNQPIRPVPLTPTGITPAGDFSWGGGAGQTMEASNPILLASWPTSGSVTFKINATLDRLIYWIPAAGAAATTAYYIGLAQRLYPTTLDPIHPVVHVDLKSIQTSSSPASGGSTREPGATSSSANNWRVQIAVTGAPHLRLANNGVDAVVGRSMLSPVMLAAVRAPQTSTRCVLLDVYCTSTVIAGTDQVNGIVSTGVDTPLALLHNSSLYVLTENF